MSCGYVGDSEAYSTLPSVHGRVNHDVFIWCLHVPLIGAVLAAVLRSHGEASAAVAERGLAAIARLSYSNGVNAARLGEAGACEGVWTLLSAV